MFAPATDLIAVTGDMAMFSLLASAGTLVATLVEELTVRGTAQPCSDAPVKNSNDTVVVPNSATRLTTAHHDKPQLTVIAGGRCRDDFSRRLKTRRERSVIRSVQARDPVTLGGTERLAGDLNRSSVCRPPRRAK